MTTSSASASLPSFGVALALEATKVAEMIEKLPTICYPKDGAIVPLLQQAGVESFFVNVRCLLEFLGIHPAERDRSARDLLGSGWKPPVDKPTQDRLHEHWRIATQHTVHFGQVRTKAKDGTVETVPVERADLEAIADDVLTLWDKFVAEINKAGLMYKSTLRKRGNFPYWNVDGTIR
jgi:hypothetical protein